MREHTMLMMHKYLQSKFHSECLIFPLYPDMTI